MHMLITDIWNFDYTQECVKWRPSGQRKVNPAEFGIPPNIVGGYDDDDEHGCFL